MKTPAVLIIASLCAAATLHAGPRVSSNYSIPTDAVDAGGGRSYGDGYVNDATIGGIAGISSIAAPLETLKTGYVGQIYEAIALTVSAPASTVVETGTLPLSATLTMDDATMFNMDPAAVGWSRLNGSFGINAGGVVMAPAVYQVTAATVQGTWGGLTGILPFTILDTDNDNFGTYAADGIPDGWQVQYFGVRNPLAGPTLDPDGDGQDNLFEYHACLVPTDPQSFLSMSILDTPGGGHAVTFSPRFNDCTYSLMGSTDLSLWAPVTGVITDNGTVRTIDDPGGTRPRRFYRLDIQRGE